MTRAIEKEDQAFIEETLEKVRALADESVNEGEFLSKVFKTLPEVDKIFPSRQSDSGGITFSILIKCKPRGEKEPQTKTATIKKKFSRR